MNLDTFLKGERAKQLWLGKQYFESKVTENNSETLDIFEPGMQNLFDAGRIVIDVVLEGEF